MERHPNWIDGAPCPSREGLVALHARDGSARRLGEWPLSGAGEVAEAFEALGAARGGLAASDEHLRRALRGPWPAPGPALQADLAARLALTADEAGRLLVGASSFGIGLERQPTAELVVFSAGRRMLFPELLRRLVGLRLAGARVLVLASPELPQVTSAAHAALQELGLGGKGLAVLHGTTPGGWRELGARAAALPAMEFRGRLGADGRAALVGSASREPGLAATLEGLPAPLERRFELGALARTWGLGLDGLSRKSAGPRLELVAERLVLGAFGRVPALAGLAHRAPLTGTVEVAHYAAFVEATLAAMECLGEHEAPLPALGGAGLVERYRSRWRAALDEGAVLLMGGQVSETPAGPILAPTLLVNVPSTGETAAPAEPLAQLRLVRLRKPH